MKQILCRIRLPATVVGFSALLMVIQAWYSGTNMWLWFGGLILAALMIGYGIYLSCRDQQARPIKTKMLALLIGALVIALATILHANLLRVDIFNHCYKQISPTMMVYYCLLAPMIEEVIYRQIFYHEWLKNMGSSPWMGRLIVGFVFVFMHFPVGYASWLFYTLAACGLFIAYEVSGDNVKWSIGLHMFNNILVLL